MPQRCSTPSSGDIGLGLARHTRLGACLFPKELHVQNQPDGDDDSEEEIILKITRLPYGARNMGLTDEEEDEEWQYQGPYLGKCGRIEYSKGYPLWRERRRRRFLLERWIPLVQNGYFRHCQGQWQRQQVQVQYRLDIKPYQPQDDTETLLPRQRGFNLS